MENFTPERIHENKEELGKLLRERLINFVNIFSDDKNTTVEEKISIFLECAREWVQSSTYNCMRYSGVTTDKNRVSEDSSQLASIICGEYWENRSGLNRTKTQILQSLAENTNPVLYLNVFELFKVLSYHLKGHYTPGWTERELELIGLLNPYTFFGFELNKTIL